MLFSNLLEDNVTIIINKFLANFPQINVMLSLNVMEQKFEVACRLKLVSEPSNTP